MEDTNNNVPLSNKYSTDVSGKPVKKAGKLPKILTALVILILVGLSSALYIKWQKEVDKVTQYKQAASATKEFADLVSDNVYGQFKKVDERGHWMSSMTCEQIVASNNYKTTKPEYVRLVNGGACNTNSDNYTPNYSSFTPYLQEKAKQINTIYTELGDSTIPDFQDKQSSNFLFDTCWDMVHAGALVGDCNLDTTF